MEHLIETIRNSCFQSYFIISMLNSYLLMQQKRQNRIYCKRK